MIDDPTRPLEDTANGHAPMPTPINQPRPGPRMPGRSDVTISMAGAYGEARMRMKIWKNYPHKLATMIASNDEDQTVAALCQIILWHNDWCDEDGEPLPQLRPPRLGSKEGDDDFEDAKAAFYAFWDRIPQELAFAISTAIGAEVSKLGVSVRERRRS